MNDVFELSHTVNINCVMRLLQSPIMDVIIRLQHLKGFLYGGLLPTLQSPKHVEPEGVVGAISRSLYNRTLAAISSIVVLQLESLQRHRFQGSSHKSPGCNVQT